MESLRAATHLRHNELDRAIMAAGPFDNLTNYSKFLRAQDAFHRDILPLYATAGLSEVIGALAPQGRLQAIAEDAKSLSVDLLNGRSTPPPDLPLAEVLGWIYVAEGSNLGAAFLFKAATALGLTASHGASHLTEPKEGRAARWRVFSAALNQISLSQVQDRQVIAGANAAFGAMIAHVNRLLY